MRVDGDWSGVFDCMLVQSLREADDDVKPVPDTFCICGPVELKAHLALVDPEQLVT